MSASPLLHFKYPTMFAVLRERATRVHSNQPKRSPNRDEMEQKPQTIGVTHRDIQNVFESTSAILDRSYSFSYENAHFTSRDSNRQLFEPSSFTSFHQRRPTNSRPVTFLTVQKSNARRRTMTTKSVTKFVLVRAEPRKYLQSYSIEIVAYTRKAPALNPM
jgi:hypothetical protein